MGGGGVEPHEEGHRRHLRRPLPLDRRQAGPLLLRRHPLPPEPSRDVAEADEAGQGGRAQHHRDVRILERARA
uniref:Uncharacterized protein n=1 Tax=Arundo donax TaxID=35708 RepID=A0A0A9EAI2_ARUDO